MGFAELGLLEGRRVAGLGDLAHGTDHRVEIALDVGGLVGGVEVVGHRRDRVCEPGRWIAVGRLSHGQCDVGVGVASAGDARILGCGAGGGGGVVLVRLLAVVGAAAHHQGAAERHDREQPQVAWCVVLVHV